MKQTLCLATLGELDNGVAGLMVDAEIRRAILDLEDRATEDGKPRKVVIQLELTLLDGAVVAHLVAEAKVPPRRSKATVANLKSNGGKPLVQFQSLDRHDPNQRTIDESEVPNEEN